MPSRTPQIHRLILFILSAIVVLFIGLNSVDGVPRGISRDDPQNDDGWQNLTYAYNLARYGVFSLSMEDNPNIQPDYYREPVYPALIALGLTLFGDLDNVDYQCYIEGRGCGFQRVTAKRVDAFVLLALAWTVAVVAFRLTNRWLAAYLSVGLLFSANYFLLDSLFSEVPAALFLLLHAWLLYEAFRTRAEQRRALLFAALSSIALGLLILTKAIFLYWLMTLGAGLLFYFAIRGRRQTSFVKIAILLLVPAVMMVNLWMVRNFNHFGKYTLTSRSGGVLAVRAEYSYMTAEEYLASFVQFAPDVIKPILLNLVDMTPYYRLDRNLEGSYYQRTTRATNESQVIALARQQYGLSIPINDRSEDDFALASLSEEDEVALSSAAVRTILNRLDKHLLLIPVFAYRGAFVLMGQWPFNPVPEALFTVLRIIALFFVPTMFWSVASALRNRSYARALFFAPALFSYAFHAAATHYIPRYSAPLVPILIIALVMTAIPMGSWLWRKATHETAQPARSALAPGAHRSGE